MPADADLPPHLARLRWWREVLYIVGFYLAYSLVRNQFGSAAVGAERAFRNAERVIGIERALGLFFEQPLQALFLDWTGFIRFWNIWYATAHFLVTPVALAWLFRQDPRRYRRWRNTILATSAIALVGYSLYPLMPPRLLNEPASRLGGAAYATEDFGFVDTMSVVGGLWSFDDRHIQRLSNQYAAMPSLHIGWSTWVALALIPLLRARWAKTLALAYPAAMFFCIVVTANHFWLDAVGGWACLAAGYLVARRLTHLVEPRAQRQPAVCELTA